MRALSLLVPVAFVALTACAGPSPSNVPSGGSGGDGGGLGGGLEDNGGGGGGAGTDGATDGKTRANGTGASQDPNAVVCTETYEPSQQYFMSPDDSGSIASPAYARELLRGGLLPAPERVREHEFMNYYHFAFPEPQDRLEIHADLAPTADPSRYELLVAVRARSAPRPQVGITFVVDGSASMAGPGMARARRAVFSLIQSLQQGDVINVVKWSSTAEPLAEGVVVQDATKVELGQQIIDQLAPFGGSDLTGGLQKGYQLAHDHFVAGGHNRVVLISDGGANPSAYDLEQITKQLGAADDAAIHLTGIGVGPATGYNDALMDAVTDAARGSYAYLDSDIGADELLQSRFDELMFVAEEAIGVTLTLPGYFGIENFSGEQVETDADLVRDQHIAPGDTVVLRQELVLEDGCPASVVGSLAYAPSILASVSSGKGAAYSLIDTVDVPLGSLSVPSANMAKARAIHAVAAALRLSDPVLAEQALQAAHGVIDAAQDLFVSETGQTDAELADLDDTIVQYFQQKAA